MAGNTGQMDVPVVIGGSGVRVALQANQIKDPLIFIYRARFCPFFSRTDEGHFNLMIQ